MSRQDIAAALAAIRLFRGVDPAHFTHMAQQARARLASEAGDMVYEPGDPADAIFVAYPRGDDSAGPRGIVELSLPTSGGGARRHLEHIVAGDVFGEFEFVAGGLGTGKTIRRSAARVAVPCHLYRVPFTLLAPLLAEDEAVRTRLIKLSFDRLMSALNVTSAHLLGDRDVAFANWLINAAENLGIAEGRQVSFSRPIGQREIADALGVSRETMSLRLNEWERAGLLNTGGQSQRLEILDYPRVALRAAVQKDAPREAIAAALAEVDADLARGDLVRARNIGLDMLMVFPSSPELRHRVALANIRAGNVREALAGLAYGGYATGGDVTLLRERVLRGAAHPETAPDRLFFGAGEAGQHTGDDDDGAPGLPLPELIEDIAAIEARAQKELAFAAEGETRRTHAAASADYYESIHDALGGTYAGINAAMMALIAGDGGRARQLANEVARKVERHPAGYWAHATMAEARLIGGDDAGAAEALANAHGAADATDGHRSSTRLQLRRIGGHLGKPIDKLLAALPVGTTAVFSGPLFRGADLADEAQDAIESRIATAAAEALAAGGVRYLYGALASGADIAIAEAGLAAGAELHVVLPFPVEKFVETSVAIGNTIERPDGWTTRFWQCLRKSASLTTLVERSPETRHRDAYFFHGFQLAAGLALLRADALSAEVAMIAVDDGRGHGSIAGTHAVTGKWAEAGRAVIAIPVSTGHGAREPAPAQPDPFRPVVFVWPVGENADLAPLIADVLRASEINGTALPRTTRDRRTGAAIAVATTAEAIALMTTLADAADGSRQPVRIIADFGPAVDAKGVPVDVAISRLVGASDIAGLPAGMAIAAPNFAAVARAEASVTARFIPIGRTAPAPQDKGGDSDGRPLPSREVYAVTAPSQPARSRRRTRR